MSVADVVKLLQSWSMPEDVILKFEENEIDEAALLKLPPNIISNLIVRVGPLVKFQGLLEEYKKLNKKDFLINQHQKNTEVDCDGPLSKIRRIEDNSSLEPINILSISAEELQNAEIITSLPSTSFTSNSENLLNNNKRNSLLTKPSNTDCIVPSNFYVEINSGTEEYNLKEILSSNTDGVLALKYFELHKKLDDRHRNLIARCLIDHELKDDVNKQIPGARFKFIANKILELFNSNGIVETSVTWFDPDRGAAKGKLIGRYHNLRRKFIKTKAIEKRGKPKNDLEIVLVEDDEESLNLLLWLKNNVAPWPKVLEYWKKTSVSRLQFLNSENEPVYKYIGTYLPLKQPQALSLLEIDFDHLYPQKGLNLYTAFKKLMLFMDNKLSQKNLKEPVSLTALTDELQILHVFTGLHVLFPVITCSNKKSNNWRPSRDEMKDGFLLRVNTHADIKPALILRRSKLSKFSLNLQPLPILVGIDLSHIEEQYVAIDDFLYPVESPLKAIDLTFKSVHALHAKYAPEAEQIWLFLQIAVYQIKTQWDRKLGSVSTLTQEFEVFKPLL